MELLHTLGSVLGIGLLSGFRLYLTVLVLGLGIRFEFLKLGTHLQDLAILADSKVLAVAGAGFAIEFLADKIPWIDSLWDSFHTVIRPVGAALLATAALGELDPVTKTMVVLACGGVAMMGHTSKAATRLAVNHSPEPFTNVGLSIAEDLMTPVGIWFVLAHPVATLVILGCFAALFCWLSPKIYRLLKVEMTALGALFARWFLTRDVRRSAAPSLAATSEPVRTLWDSMKDRMAALPASHAEALRDKLGVVAPEGGVKCAATRSVGRMRNSTGYLCVTGDRLAFVAKRWFSWRVHTVALADVSDVRWKRRLLLDQLTVATAGGTFRFNVFKVAPARAREVGLARAAG